MFRAGIADATDWRNLIFGGWWSWLEKWGKLVSIFLGVYYLYVVGRWLLTTLFSLRILYQEHGFSSNLLWGLGLGQDVFPMRFYGRWRRFKQHFAPEESRRGWTPLPLPQDYEPLKPRVPPHHEYLTVHEAERPPLPSWNVYPPLPSSDRSSTSSAEKQKGLSVQGLPVRRLRRFWTGAASWTYFLGHATCRGLSDCGHLLGPRSPYCHHQC